MYVHDLGRTLWRCSVNRYGTCHNNIPFNTHKNAHFQFSSTPVPVPVKCPCAYSLVSVDIHCKSTPVANNACFCSLSAWSVHVTLDLLFFLKCLCVSFECSSPRTWSSGEWMNIYTSKYVILHLCRAICSIYSIQFDLKYMHVCRCHSQVCISILNKYAAIVDPYPLECPFLYPLDARSCIRWTSVLVSVGCPFLYPLDARSCIHWNARSCIC